MTPAPWPSGPSRNRFRKIGLLAGLFGALLGGAAVWAASRYAEAPQDRASVEAVVRDYLLENPEILREASQRLQQRETANVVQAQRAALETPFGSAWAGAQNGDVVLVEFFDYACGYCRAANAEVNRLLAEDKMLKVVWRELPVLGPGSVEAARVSLAAAGSGRFRQFHDRLFSLGRPTDASIAAAAQAAGLRAPARHPAADAEIEKNYRLANAIGATGTPTFVVGNRVMQGNVGYETLKRAVAEARRSG